MHGATIKEIRGVFPIRAAKLEYVWISSKKVEKIG
jgi:hypothetical protein